jgi:hypothetical protein
MLTWSSRGAPTPYRPHTPHPRLATTASSQIRFPQRSQLSQPFIAARMSLVVSIGSLTVTSRVFKKKTSLSNCCFFGWVVSKKRHAQFTIIIFWPIQPLDSTAKLSRGFIDADGFDFALGTSTYQNLTRGRASGRVTRWIWRVRHLFGSSVHRRSSRRRDMGLSMRIAGRR